MRGKTGADREISVNTYTGGFTTMLNHHLRNRNLSLKAVGLLSKMLSLPPDWDYSIRGLAMLNTDGIDGIRTAMKELEHEGYRSSEQSFRTMAQYKVKIEGSTVTRNGEPMFKVHRRHAARKTQGCYRELMPTLEYIGREKAQETKQEKPSIRDQLKAAAKSQPEKKAPAKQKSHDIGLE